MPKNSPMEFPVPVSDLYEYLPHRPPMVWVDEVLEVGKDYKGLSGACRIKVDNAALYVSNKKELRGSAAIEFTAQAFGYLKATYQVLHQFSDPPKETYLTGVRKCSSQFSDLDLSGSLDLKISLSVIREILPLTYVRGELTDMKTGKTLAETEIQVYFD